MSSEFYELSFLSMEAVKFGVEINQSGEKRELHYEWSYGEIKPRLGNNSIHMEIKRLSQQILYLNINSPI